MRKGLLIGVAAIVLAALLGAPPVLGWATEQEFERIRERARSEIPFVQAWSVTEYEGGYLGADARSEIIVGDPSGESRTTIVLDHRFDYAPGTGGSLVQSVTTPRIDSGPLRQIVERLFGADRTPLTLRFDVDLTGKREITVQSPAVDGARDLPLARVQWQGLNAQLEVGRSEEWLAYEASMPGARVQPRVGEVSELRLESLTASGRYEASRFEGVWTGGASGQIGHILAKSPQAGDLELVDFAFSDNAKLEGDLFGFDVTTSAKQFSAPAYELNKVEMQLMGERIAPALMRAMQAGAERMGAQGDAASASGGSAWNAMRDVPWGEIAANEPEIRLERFAAQTPDGAVQISARVGLRAPDNEQQKIGPRDLTRFAHGQVNASAPEPVVIDALARSIALRGDNDPGAARSSARSTIQQLTAQGMLTVEDGQIRSSASYDQGMIRINGQSLFGG